MYANAHSEDTAQLPTGGLKLVTSDNWVEWHNQLKINARALGLLDAINTAQEDLDSDVLKAPEAPTIEKAKGLEGDESVVQKLTMLDRIYTYKLQSYNKREKGEGKLMQWIGNTVEGATLSNIYAKIEGEKKDVTLRRVVRKLKLALAPSDATLKENSRSNYRAVLQRAQKANTNPVKWHADWMKAYNDAQVYNISDIEGTTAIRDFLRAVGARFEPTWADAKLNALDEAEILGKKIDDSFSLETCAATFHKKVSDRQKTGTKAQGVFLVMGKSSRPPQLKCPCKEKQHNWAPNTCWELHYAITKEGAQFVRNQPSEDTIQAIKRRYESSEYKKVRELVQKSGWKIKSQTKPANSSSRFVAAFIYPPDLKQTISGHGVFATMHYAQHPLSQSTLLDNCSGLHIVNSMHLLEPGSYHPSFNDHVQAGKVEIPISGRGTRVLKNFFADEAGNYTVDLELRDVALIEGFYTNIVSYAMIKQAGAWINGCDDTLCIGTFEDHRILRTLKLYQNLTFLEYIPLDDCSDSNVISGVFAVSNPIVMPVLNNASNLQPQRSGPQKSSEPRAARYDSEELWHLRSGHLGSEALSKLVLHARNAHIKGTKRIKCETCALTYASKVISRRTPEYLSPRPFWRVHWDLQDFELSYNGMRWLLLIKDEYSGMTYAQPLPSKAQPVLFNALLRFERWVQRQYGISICKLKHDNEPALIGRSGQTIYQQWAQDEGIDLKLSPPYTHEPNGRVERANQEITLRSIAMLTSANLPSNLWSESTVAAAYLYNRSPKRRNMWKSPIETLNEWFQKYASIPVVNSSVKLSPDWSGLYAYGCRAYPLNRDREAGRDNRGFKTRPRGHIGYLVGYVASNLYRIWIPSLERVVVTRNVQFNESVFYDPYTESSSELPVRELEAQFAQMDLDDLPDSNIFTLDALQILPVSSNSGVEAPVSVPLQDQNLKDAQQRNEPTDTMLGLRTPRQTPEVVEDLVQPAQAQDIELQTVVEHPARGTDALLAEATQPQQENEAQVGDGLATQHTEQPQQEESRQDAGKQPERRSKRIQAYGGPRDWKKLRTKRPDIHFTNCIWDPRLIGVWSDQPKPLNNTGTCRALFSVLSAQCVQHGNTREGRSKRKTQIMTAQEETSEHDKSLSINSVAKISELPPPPNHWRNLNRHPMKAQFVKAALTEVEALLSNGTWIIADTKDVPTTPLPLRWVFTYKQDAEGLLERCKARICVRGDLQEGSLIESTYAATLAMHAARVMLAIAAHLDLEILQFDVKNAFLNSKLNKSEQPIYCELPEGFKREGKCVRLLKALYGLRESPLLWFLELSGTLQRLGLVSSKEEPCIFYNEDRTVFVIFYVDDILVFFHRKNIQAANELVQGLKDAYEMSDKGDARYFLGIQIIRDRPNRKLYLCHATYIKKIAERFDQHEKTTYPSTPIPATEIPMPSEQASKKEVKEYQEIIGSILFTAITVRPDVAYAAAALSRHLTNPSEGHMRAALQTIRYLYNTMYVSLQYGGSSEIQTLEIASDASFADDVATRRSSQGYLISLFGGPVIWKATRQKTVSTSTTEAELLALSEVAKEAMALVRLFRDIELKIEESEPTIHCDNQQTIRLVLDESVRLSTRLRHVDIHNMWLKQEYQKGSFKVSYLPTAEMPADGFTKPLTRQRFEQWRGLLNLIDLRGKDILTTLT